MEVFTATMNNFSAAVEANAKAQESAGSAEKENQKYQDSLQGSLAALKTAWEDFSRSMVDSGMITGVLKTLTKTLDFLSSDFGQATIKAVALGTAIHGATKLVVGLGTRFTKLGSVINKIGKMMGLIKATSAAKSVTQLTKATKTASQAAKSLGSKGAKSFTAMGTAAASATKGTAKLSKTTSTAVQTTSKLGRATSALSGVASALAPVLTNPYVLAGAAAVGLLAVVKHLTSAETKYKKAVEKTKETSSAYDEAASKVEKYRKEVEKANNAGKTDKNAEKQLKYWESVLAIKKEILAIDQEEEALAWKDSEKVTKYGGADGTEVQETTKGAEAVANYNNALRAVNQAQAKYNKLLVEGKGNTEAGRKAQNQYAKAYEQLESAQKEAKEELEQYNKYGHDGIKDGKKTHKQLKEIAKDHKDNVIAINDNSKAYDKLKKKAKNGELFDSKNISSTTKQIKSMGDSFGIVENEAGKVTKLDFSQLSKGITDIGGSAEDVEAAFNALKDENPNIKVNVDGTEYAISQLKVVDGELQPIKQGATAKVDADTSSGQAKVSTFDRIINALTGKADVSADTSKGESKVQAFASSISSLNPVVNVAVKITRTVKEIINTIKGEDETAHGARNFPHYAGGVTNAQVNEYGFEIIESPSGSMRVANGGARGDTYIEEGSAVYTHGQSMRMLQKVGMTEADLLRGKRDKNKDVPIKRIKPLQGFAKGLSKKQYAKKVSKLREQYEDELSKLDDKAAINNWSEAKHLSMIKKTYKKYKKKFKALAKKRAKGVSSKSFSLSELADYQDTLDDSAIDKFEERIDGMVGTLADLKAVQKLIKKSKNLTADEKEDLLKDAYARRIEYLQELLDEDEISVDEYLYKIEVYYKKGMITAKEYYDYVKEANEKAVDDMLEEWERAVDRGNMTLEEFREKIKELYKEGKMSAADYANYMDDIADQIAEREQEAIDEQLEREEEARELAEEAAEEARELAEAAEEARIEAEEAAAEAAEEAAEAYHDAIVEQIEENLSLLESSKYTYDEMLDYIKYYYEQAIISAKEYYEYLEQMAETQVNKGQTQADRQWNYMSEYISRQIELEEEENDLLEAKADLLDAQNKKVKVYVEGQGFVYQQDMDAVKEAESSLKSTTSVWQELQDLMSEAETITSLETAGILAGTDLVSLVEGLNKNDSTSWANLISLLASNKASYDLASDLGITNPNQIRTSTTINGQTFNISNVSLPSVTDANSFMDGLTSLANQAIQSSSTRS